MLQQSIPETYFNVYFRLLRLHGCCNFSVVHDAGSETVVFQGAGSFFAAVASMCCGGLISVQNFLVVFLNDSFHIVHA